jgi:hypothetical protein
MIIAFITGGIFGALMMALCSVEAYSKGYQDGMRDNE